MESVKGRKTRAQPIGAWQQAGPWSVMQRVEHPDPAAANSEALHDLENGATGLTVVFAGAVGAYRYGLPASEKGIPRALGGIHLAAGIAADRSLVPPTPDPRHSPASLLKLRRV